jgi:hypothetical protein
MSKKKKKNGARSEASAEEATKAPGASASDDTASAEDREETESSAAEASHADAEHGEAGGAHGHGGHDPVEEDRPNNGLILLITVISCATVIAFVVGVRELFNYWSEQELHSKVLSVQSSELRALRAAEQQKLGHYQWVNQKDGVVRIPVDRAVEITVASYRNPPPPPPEPKLAPPPAPAPEDGKPEEKKGVDKKDEKKDNKGEDKPKEPRK